MGGRPVDLQVCITCLGDNKERAGEAFYRALEKYMGSEKTGVQINLRPVECFAICNRQCTVTVSQAGKWQYIIGDLDIKEGIPALFDYIKAYSASDNGTPPLKERPAIVRKGTIARLPSQ